MLAGLAWEPCTYESNMNVTITWLLVGYFEISAVYTTG